jgi:hypothetical protein
MRTFAHLINPFKTPGMGFPFYQQVTFETMRAAQAFAAGTAEAALYAAHYPEDADGIPGWFNRTPPLARSILDLGEFPNPRRLPLLADILDRLYTASTAQYLIYSNADIALMPHFYAAVNQFIENGLDGFVINRRTISGHYTRLDEIPVMYSETGMPHEGFDCFVFRREAYPAYEFGEVVIGAPGVGRLLLWNLIRRAANFHLFTTNHLTFHLGNDAAWEHPANWEFERHNWREARRYFDRHREAMLGEARYQPYMEDVRRELGLPRDLRGDARRGWRALRKRLASRIH